MNIRVLVCYDVKTSETGGARRLRRVAEVCESYGVRVQFSVFECNLPEAAWVQLKARLLREIEPAQDSLRFYFMDRTSFEKREHHGAKPAVDPEGPLVV